MGLFSARKHISLREMGNAFRFNYSRETKDAFVEEIMTDLVEEAEEEALLRIKDKIGRNLNIEEWQHPTVPIDPPKSLTNNIFSAVAKSWDDDSLLARFESLMLHDQAFLEPGLTLLEVAERLHSNKTYISRLVNNTYNLAFPDLINTLRVDFAEQYIVAHRSAKQAEIATACGFLSASSFNNTFKKVTGMTPKIWLATFDHQNGVGSTETPEENETPEE
jgi:AraC-like DNA-binding protein